MRRTRTLMSGILAVAFATAWLAGASLVPDTPDVGGEPEGVVRVANLIYAGDKSSKCFSDHFLTQAEQDSTISTSRRSFGDPFTVPGSNAARRIAMKFPSRTAFRYARIAAPSSATHSCVSSRSGSSLSTSSWLRRR